MRRPDSSSTLPFSPSSHSSSSIIGKKKFDGERWTKRILLLAHRTPPPSGMKENTHDTAQEDDSKLQVVDCVVIGAGASGLQCAAELLVDGGDSDGSGCEDSHGQQKQNQRQHRTQPSRISVVVLEGRSRVGGRIRTDDVSVCLSANDNEIQDSSASSTTHTFKRDIGAAWVHGIGLKGNPHGKPDVTSSSASPSSPSASPSREEYSELNPMVELLLERHGLSSPRSFLEGNESKESQILDPIFVGNPETRPESVLLLNSRRSSNSVPSPTPGAADGAMKATQAPSSVSATPPPAAALAMYVDGKQVPIHPQPRSSSDDSPLTHQRVENVNMIDAVRRHYDLLKKAETEFYHTISSSSSPPPQSESESESLQPEKISVERFIDDFTLRSTNKDDDRLCNMGDLEEQFGSSSSLLSSQKQLWDTLTAFFRFILTNWFGISLNQIQFETLLPVHKSDDEYRGDDGDFDGPHCKVIDGMITVLDPLIERIEDLAKQQQYIGNTSITNDNKIGDGTVIQCNKTVTKIVDDPIRKRVRVETNCGMIYEAKVCVCTIPLGCLQHHTLSSSSTEATSNDSDSDEERLGFFQPQLDPPMVRAIHSLSPGSYKKVFMTFNTIFWPVEPPAIGLALCSNSVPTFPGNYLLLTNVWAKHGIPCLEAALCGDMGAWAYDMSDEFVKQSILEFIGTAMGVPSLIPGNKSSIDDTNSNVTQDLSQSLLSPVLPSCTSISVTRWEEDEYTRGSYSEYKLGTVDDDVEHLQQVAAYGGRLHFAGEHTESEHMGSVHGALMSGKRVARKVKEQFFR